MNEQNQHAPAQPVPAQAERESYVKPQVTVQPLDAVVRGGGGISGDFPGFSGGRP